MSKNRNKTFTWCMAYKQRDAQYINNHFFGIRNFQLGKFNCFAKRVEEDQVIHRSFLDPFVLIKQPFTVVENKEFRSMIKLLLYSSIQIPSSETLRRDLN